MRHYLKQVRLHLREMQAYLTVMMLASVLIAVWGTLVQFV